MYNFKLKSKNMKNQKKSAHKKNYFETFSAKISQATGSSYAFIIAFSLVLVWAISGPAFHYSESWQMVINTGTTIITFLMVFLIQKAQNKDSLAIQLKLNELVAAHEYASNRLVDVESLTEDELKIIQKYYSKMNEIAKSENSLQESHSIDEAQTRHDMKKDMEQDLRNKHPKKVKNKSVSE